MSKLSQLLFIAPFQRERDREHHSERRFVRIPPITKALGAMVKGAAISPELPSQWQARQHGAWTYAAKRLFFD
ncbi:MAG TPA: hypothetical protein VFH15_03090 [Pyrinomonadaceae bacterium]|nr:hypothetical protein [Pyrinomonadaceae bacterium]